MERDQPPLTRWVRNVRTKIASLVLAYNIKRMVASNLICKWMSAEGLKRPLHHVPAKSVA